MMKDFNRYLTEESVGYAKLKSRRFRKIRYNEEERAVMEDDAGSAISGVSLYIEDNPEDYDQSYYNMFDSIKTKRSVGSVGRRKDFEVFYSFSNSIRGQRKYGNPNWSARFLYEFLCSHFNAGERFVDTYFNTVFPLRPVHGQLTRLLDRIEAELAQRWNGGDLRGGQWAAFYKFQAEQMSFLRGALEEFSRDLREDVISCLAMGMIPLNFSLRQSTVRRREEAGLDGQPPFYATSWLIRQVEVHIVLSDTNSRYMFYSDTYRGKYYGGA